jgi:NodT family efflux transporter outer membrane factor (OMF) lipoprotein
LLLSRSIVIKFIGLAVLVLLSACTTLGPDYQEPEVSWLTDWQSDLYGQVNQSTPSSDDDLRFWWQRFDDLVLNDLIAKAQQQNPGLRIAGLRILESRAQLGIAGSNLYPQLQQASGAASYIDSRENGGVTNNDLDFTSYQAGLTIGWELDFWGRFARGIESADAAYLSSISNQQDVQVLLYAQIADLYFSYRTTLASIAIAKKNAAIQKLSYELTERLFKGGQQSELDFQQAKTQYLSTLSTVPPLEISLTQTSNALAALLGRSPGKLAELAKLPNTLPAILPVSLAAVPAQLLSRRPDVRVAAWQVAAQSAQIGIAEADYYPAISLLGSVAWSGSSINGSSDTTVIGAGPSLTWNLFDYGRIADNVRLQDARLQQAIESFQNTVLQAAQEIDNSAYRVFKTEELDGILLQSVAAAERSLALANKLYLEGYADFSRVLNAQRAVFSQDSNKLANQGNRISATISLYKAMGGGWVNTPIDQIIPVDTRDKMKDRSDWGDLLTAPLAVPKQSPALSSGISQ